MNYFRQRRLHKHVKNVLHTARHARHIRGDLAPAAARAGLQQAEDGLRQAWKDRVPEDQLDAAAQKVLAAAARVNPPRPYPSLRENVEVIAVAFAVAFGFRTYFIQPFSIPTGSMQPTLYGIVVEPQAGPGLLDHFPLSVIPRAIMGQRYIEVRARETGVIQPFSRANDIAEVFPSVRRNFLWHFIRGDLPPGMVRVFSIAGQYHCIPWEHPDGQPSMAYYFKPGDLVTNGQVLASGRVQAGDHVFVNKLRYNFGRPRRGDIIVFSTEKIAHPQVIKNTFYIKRLVGLPNEDVSIRPPYLVIDGKEITEPYPFERLVEGPGYGGYTLQPMSLLATETNSIHVGPSQFLPFGDNTRNSLDGRYFGPVETKYLVAPAFMVYWPFGTRWGLVR